MQREEGFSLMGDARTVEEVCVEKIVGLLNFAGSGAVSYKRIEAGITNSNWIVRRGPDAFFVKVHGENTHILIDRTAAISASVQAGELGVGPRLIARFDDPGAEVYEFLQGYRNCTVEDLGNLHFRKQLLRSYKDMHASTPLPVTRTGIGQLEQRYSVLLSESIECPQDVPALVGLCREAGERVAASKPEMRPCHNDSYAPNFMIRDADQSIRIVDWEYAANNDPTWDLTMIALSSGLPPEVDWLAEYFGSVPQIERTKATLYAGILALSWGIWARLQTKYSSISFDYLAYSDMLLDHARRLTSAPEWKEAMCQLP
ncbi:phosphotransferase [Hyphomonas sp. NPDC076900]|uniref:phosphotransferase n=1 Tax=unclassified Hyphomonas TaxID=2630699 RepID=UPI003D0736DD